MIEPPTCPGNRAKLRGRESRCDPQSQWEPEAIAAVAVIVAALPGGPAVEAAYGALAAVLDAR